MSADRNSCLLNSTLRVEKSSSFVVGNWRNISTIESRIQCHSSSSAYRPAAGGLEDSPSLLLDVSSDFSRPSMTTDISHDNTVSCSSHLYTKSMLAYIPSVIGKGGECGEKGIEMSQGQLLVSLSKKRSRKRGKATDPPSMHAKKYILYSPKRNSCVRRESVVCSRACA